MLPAKLLSHIFSFIEWQDLLLVAPNVCGEWRKTAETNTIWREQLRRNRNLFSIDCLLEFENMFKSRNQEELNTMRLHNSINETYCKIGLLIRHVQCRHSFSAFPSQSLYLGKSKCEGDIPNNAYNAFLHEIKEFIAICQTLIYLVEKIRLHELESVQNSKSLFRWTVSTLRLHPNVVLNSSNALDFLKSCSQNGTNFIQSIFVNMMKTMYKYKERNIMLGREAQELAKTAEGLNTQLEEYTRSMDGILVRYSKISRQQDVKFSMKKLVKRGVIVSTQFTNERKKVISFVLSCASQGSYHLNVYMAGKQIDVILLEIADILSKVHENIMAAWFDNFLLNTANTLRLIEKYMLR